eukprot:194571-Amphidinium_carterae.1
MFERQSVLSCTCVLADSLFVLWCKNVCIRRLHQSTLTWSFKQKPRLGCCASRTSLVVAATMEDLRAQNLAKMAK